MAATLDRVRHPQTQWTRPKETPASCDWSSGQTVNDRRCTERSLVRRLQGPLQDGRRSLLLSTHGHRRVQPLLARLPSAARHLRQRCEACVYSPLSRGLPNRIRTDNGVPFATNTLARLSRLSAWWVRLGVMPEFIEPGKPQQNGRHERMHKTLKAETTR